jgi:pimeloyl-ACP methyl ester carboxylesterase
LWGYEVNERGKALDAGFARHLSDGRTGEAMATMLEGLTPRWFCSTLARPLGALVGRFAFGELHPDFANDVLVEAEAEVACDARHVLPRISVPLLLVCGDRDVYFDKAVYEETARLIPDCTLRMYAGKGHMGVVSDGRVAEDVLDFARRHPGSQPKAHAGRA